MKTILCMGNIGSYLEQQKESICEGDILVKELKEETAQKVRNGEMAYRKTLLGGCTNIDTCECSILGKFADCRTSKCAVIKSSNIHNLIERTEKELKSYDIYPVEYLSTKAELDKLIRYKNANMVHEHEVIEGGTK